VKMKGAEILIECLKREKVEAIFGLPGGANLPTFDALYDANMKFYLVRHEQGASHMADGYARATGKVGVCMVTSGPGATNTVTGIATAFMDSIPMVVICGQVKTHLIGNDAFQEADVVGITRPCCKHNYLVKDIKDLVRVVREAFHIARTGRPGPVVIDLPVDVTTAETEFTYTKKEVKIRGYKPVVDGLPKELAQAAKAIKQAKRPVLYVGGGAISANAAPEIRAFANKTGIPVTTTLLGLGAFPETDKLSLGMLGMHGTVYANYAVYHCDLLIAVGSRFDDRVTGKVEEFAPRSKKIHIDIDPAAISKTVQVDIPIVGDAKRVMADLNKRVEKLELKEWYKQIDGWKKEHPLKWRPGKNIRQQQLIEEVSKLTKGNAIVTTGVGQHQMWAAQWYGCTKPHNFLSSGGLGTMGFGVPAAIGAQVGRPGETVVVFDGDGSFQMTMCELATAVYYKLPIKVIIANNGFYGMVRQWQELFYHRRYSETELESSNPDFVKLAEGFGAFGIRIKKNSELVPALKKAFAYKGPAVVDCIVEREDCVYPMVPPGQAVDQIIDMA